jgi:DNA-binding transcriptional regulator YiaG
MEESEFQVLLRGVQDCYEHYMGRRHDLRTTILPTPPKPMDPAEIHALRERAGASQAFFALALNVSAKTVQAWESGARSPDGGTLKLLRLAEAHPEIVFEHLHEAEDGGVAHKSGPAPFQMRGRLRCSAADQQRPSALGQAAGLQLCGQVLPHVAGQVLGQVALQVAQLAPQVTQLSWSTVTLSIPRTVPRLAPGPSVVGNDSTASCSRCRVTFFMIHLAASGGMKERPEGRTGRKHIMRHHARKTPANN